MTKEDMDELTIAMSSVDCLPKPPRLMMPLPRRATKKPGLLFASYVQARESSSSSKQDPLPLPPSISFRDFTQTPLSATFSQPRAIQTFFQEPKKVLEPFHPLNPASSSAAIIQPCPLRPLHPYTNEVLGSFSPNAQSTVAAGQKRVIKPLPRRLSKQLALYHREPQTTAPGCQRQENKAIPPDLISHLRVPKFNPTAAPPENATRAYALPSRHYLPSTFVEELKQTQAAAKALVILEQRHNEQGEKLETAGLIVDLKKEILDLEKPDLAVNDYEGQLEALEDKSASLRSGRTALNTQLRAGIEQTPKMKALRARILDVHLRCSPMMRLPSEIRVPIFEYSIGHVLVHVSEEGFGICNAFDRNLLRETFNTLGYNHLNEHPPSDRFGSLGALPSLALLRVCRQFYSDARNIVWKQYLFDLRCVNSFASHLDRLYPTHDTTPKLDMSRVRRLCVQSTHGDYGVVWRPDETGLWQAFCASASQRMTSLKELRVGFSLVRSNMKELTSFCSLEHAWVKALLKFKQRNLAVVELIHYEYMSSTAMKISGSREKVTAFSRKLEKAILARD